VADSVFVNVDIKRQFDYQTRHLMGGLGALVPPIAQRGCAFTSGSGTVVASSI
jgi:hypothetical protein